MLIQTYFKPKDGLLNPKGPVLQSIPSQPIALANIEVDKATRDKRRKRLPSILPDKCGSLNYSRAFQTLPWSHLVPFGYHLPKYDYLYLSVECYLELKIKTKYPFVTIQYSHIMTVGSKNNLHNHTSSLPPSYQMQTWACKHGIKFSTRTKIFYAAIHTPLE